MKIAVLFPGQGSQFVGMGKDFVDSCNDAKEIMAIADDVCQAPIAELCSNGPMEELTRAVNLQPAITAVNLICWQQLKKGLADREVAYFAGHSLGEYSALQAAGVISVADAIRLVAKRGFLMGREGDVHPGGMRALLGLTIAQVEEMVAASAADGVVTAANYNTEKQIVISGDRAGLDSVEKKAASAGGKVVPLNVSVANHSPLVAGAVPEFTDLIHEVPFSLPHTPVLFNVSASVETDVTVIRQMMARQIVSQVRWYEIISKMLENGVDTFIEAGPKNVLKGMMRKIVPRGVQCLSLQFDTPKGLEECLEALHK